MSLRTLAKSDLTAIMANSTTGGAWDITVTSPSGLVKPLTGMSNDISQVIDPETGIVVSGRSASVALDMSALTAAGFTDLPRGIADSSSLPWVVEFNDIEGAAHKFKVSQSNPDRALGLVTCMLEAYE